MQFSNETVIIEYLPNCKFLDALKLKKIVEI